jgi:hypothetical protein
MKSFHTYRPTVISLCDKTGTMVKPWAEAGFECWCVDIQHSIRKDKTVVVGDGLINYVWGDCRSWLPPRGAMTRLAAMFAFPPCTDLTCTGARDFQKKRGWALVDGIQMFDACMMACQYSGVPFMVENPATSRLNTHRRQPDDVIHPWEYAGYLDDVETDNTAKKTGLWIGNGFVVPDKRPAPEPHRQDCFHTSGEGGSDERSITPAGFAKAVFQANCNLVSA